MARPSTTATAITAKVTSSGRMRKRLRGVSPGVGSGAHTAVGLSAAASRFDLVSTSDIANSARSNEQDQGRQHDYVNGKLEERRVPDITQQAETGGVPPQSNRHHPGGDHHHRDWRDIDAKQVDLGEPHPRSPASK